jgi:hypothetical protein
MSPLNPSPTIVSAAIARARLAPSRRNFELLLICRASQGSSGTPINRLSSVSPRFVPNVLSDLHCHTWWGSWSCLPHDDYVVVVQTDCCKFTRSIQEPVYLQPFLRRVLLFSKVLEDIQALLCKCNVDGRRRCSLGAMNSHHHGVDIDNAKIWFWLDRFIVVYTT